MTKWFTASAAIGLLLAACGGASTDPTTTTVSPGAATTTTSAVPTTSAPTTTATIEPGVTYASLNAAQREAVDRICAAALEGKTDLVGEMMVLQVAAGEVGIPTLETAWGELGQGADKADLLEAAAPICTELDWIAPPAATTTTVVEASATVRVQIGDLVLMTGETDGCPMTEILAGEYWVGPNRDDWTDDNGEAWQVSLSIDATGDDLKWSFSFTEGSHRLISYHENQSTFTADVTDSVGTFETIFDDSLASISGGYPDTAGTVTITCS